MKKNLFWLTVLTTVLFVFITNNTFSQYLGENILGHGDFEIDYSNEGTEATPIYVPLYGYRIPKAKDWLSASLGLFKIQSSTDIDYVLDNKHYPDNIGCPSNNMIEYCNGWFKPINNWITDKNDLYPNCSTNINIRVGSSDYFHKHGENNDCNWNNVIDYRKPANGEGYAGFLLTQNIACNNPNDVTPLWKEYLQIKLPNLKVGVYRVSFQVSKAQANSFPNECPPTNHTINEIGAYFSNDSLRQDGTTNSFNSGAHPNFNNNPFISSGSTQITGEPGANGEGGWETIAGDLTVTQNNQYNYMTIGNFSSNLWANVAPSATSTEYIRMYYFVDDVQIKRYNNCSYHIQITKEDCAYNSDEEKIGIKYNISITSTGDNCEYNSYRLFQKGGINYDNSKGEWTPITLLMSSSNSIEHTVYYSNDDIGKKVGFKIALYKESLGSETLLTEEPLEFIKEECCNCDFLQSMQMTIKEEGRTSPNTDCCVNFIFEDPDFNQNSDCKVKNIKIYYLNNDNIKTQLGPTIEPQINNHHISFPKSVNICNYPEELLDKNIVYTAEFELADGKICSLSKNKTLYCSCDCEALPQSVIQLIPKPTNSNEAEPDCCYDILLTVPENACKFVFHSLSLTLPTIDVANLFTNLKVTESIGWKASHTLDNPHRINYNFYTGNNLVTPFILGPTTNPQSIGIIGSICIPKGTPHTLVSTSLRYKVHSPSGYIELADCFIQEDLELQCKPDCCDDRIFELIVSPAGEGSHCNEDQCQISGSINLRDFGKNCPETVFTHYSLSPDHSIKYPLLPNVKTNITQYDNTSLGCLNKGESRIETLKLYSGINDEDPCIFERHIYCPNEEVAVPCSPGCDGDNSQDNVPWNQRDFKKPLELPAPCNGCYVSASYSTREIICDNKKIQQIRVDKFSIKSTGSANCAGCMTDEQIYQLIIKEAIYRNEMGFNPLTAFRNGSCFDTWRAVQSSCWVEYPDYLSNPDGSVVAYKPCANSSCCIVSLRVCRKEGDPFDYISITQNGPILGGISCMLSSMDMFWPQGFDFPIYRPDGTITFPTTKKVFCEDKCEWLGINDTAYNSSNFYGKISIDNMELNLIKLEDVSKLNVLVKNDILDCYFNNENKAVNGNIIITNILGQTIINNQYSLVQGFNNFKININNLYSGSYLIQLTTDGVVHSSNKFIILK